jgi:hypothetical protein
MKKIIFSIVLLLFANPVAAAWLSTHSHRMKLAIDSTYVGSLLENFPKYVYFSDDSIGAYARTDGYDIQFTKADGTTLLYYDRERFTISGGTATGYYHVNVDSIHATDSTWIYIYYGDIDSGDLENEALTWNSNFVGVWHLEEGYSTTASFYKDETSNNNDGQLVDANTNSAFVVAKIDSAIDFNGDADYIDIPHAAVLNPDSITVSAWIKPDASPGNFASVVSRPYDSGDWNAPFVSYQIARRGTNNYTRFNITVGGTRYAAENTSGTEWSGSTWFMASLTYDGETVRGYINGVVDATNTSPSGNIDYPENADIAFGTRTEYDVGEWLAGIIDEIRISNIERSADWLKFTYENINQADQELVWHAQEENPSPPSAGGIIMVN